MDTNRRVHVERTSQTETNLKVIAANDVMMKAFRDGLPADGKLFPDGSKITKIEWSFKKNTASPYFRASAGDPENGCVHRKGYQEIPEHARMGLQCRRRITFSRRIQKGEWAGLDRGDTESSEFIPNLRSAGRLSEVINETRGQNPWPT
jgi:hypothetical protein